MQKKLMVISNIAEFHIILPRRKRVPYGSISDRVNLAVQVNGVEHCACVMTNWMSSKGLPLKSLLKIYILVNCVYTLFCAD